MAEVLLKKIGDGLFASDDASEKFLRSVVDNEIMRCKITRARNGKHHNLAFAILHELYKYSDFSSFDVMYRQIKIATGHFTRFVQPGGEIVIEVHSLAWDKMDQTAFEQWWVKFLDLALNHIVPASQQPAMEQRIYEMLGEITPKDMELKCAK